ncbi:hypothetical protein [Yersinia phage fHe-Yen9-04]|uniref:Uncharacterized protein n=2 Tax=Eneladusvirus Yen904 TaxID=2560849 RepID=A0A2C9CX17_9CAUD|nr:hypothetical protein FDJ41_gp267 [Yersinia phage fHe-Yen9-04]SOK58544.1 hypothetical protein [Yersinia phage fHe-Yen9-04]SOK59079.1 hypothetical protein [Yersinia phage fHe-Yen9-03]VUE36313.1 hypothetical protein [Yersinia phage fHe-Yen9-04]
MNNMMEYIKCKNSIFYFIEIYLKLELRDYQIKQIINYIEMEQDEILNITGNRGSGVTLINCVFLLWNVLFGMNEKHIMILNKQALIFYSLDSIFKLYSIVKSNWPNGQHINEISRNNRHIISFNNNCDIQVGDLTMLHQIRSGLSNYIIFDDVDISNLSIKTLNLYNKKYIVTDTYDDNDYLLDV